jgi:hypothetical protein
MFCLQIWQVNPKVMYSSALGESVSPLWQDDTVLAELFFLFAHETLKRNHQEEYF